MAGWVGSEGKRQMGEGRGERSAVFSAAMEAEGVARRPPAREPRKTEPSGATSRSYRQAERKARQQSKNRSEPRRARASEERRSGRRENRQGGEVSGKQRRFLVCVAGHRHHPSRNKPEGSEKLFSFWLPVGIRAPQGCAEEAGGVPRRQSVGQGGVWLPVA